MHRTRVLPLLFVLTLAGCGVSKQIVAEKDAALATCQSALGDVQTRLAACEAARTKGQGDLEAARSAQARASADLDSCAKARQQAEAELQVAGRELESCRAQTEAARKEAEALQGREAQLRAGLQSEIDAKTVEIERLKGKLSVRVLDEILFDSGSADILPAGKAVLDKIATVLEGAEDHVRVEGHADNVPISEALKELYYSNWELSSARASSVVRYFQYGKNIDPARMEAVGLSSYRPVTSNDTPGDRQRNRRVEIVLTAAR